jgi:hypothetical protein
MARMLARYQIRRGQPLAALPARVRSGRRQDTRKHTRHCLRPAPGLVRALLASSPARRAASWQVFARSYRALLAQRFARDRAPFDALCRLATDGDVFLGCSCPSAANPDPRRCHVVLALRFMRERYPGLDVAASFPDARPRAPG